MGRRTARKALLLPVALAAMTPLAAQPTASRSSPPKPSATTAASATAPIVAWRYTVQAGDTFAAVARRMGVSMEALARENAIALPYLINVGQVLKRPGPETAHDRTPDQAQPKTRPVPTVRPAPPARALPEPVHRPEAGAPRLAWPTSGAVVSRYGTPVAGLANNGIDLAAFPGMAVRAAAGGRVIFAGTEPERFGQLILIDHGGGWVTAYAYLGKVEVKEGQNVAARQPIARIGKSGEAKKPTLHFELRRNNVPRDPYPNLPVRL